MAKIKPLIQLVPNRPPKEVVEEYHTIGRKAHVDGKYVIVGTGEYVPKKQRRDDDA